MRYSGLVERIVAEPPSSDGTEKPPVNAWEVHDKAMGRVACGESVIVLSIGQEADEVTPADIVTTAIDGLEAGRHHYTEVRGEQRLRQAIAGYHERLTGQAVTADNATVFAGAQNALFAVAQVLLEPGDEVVMLAPYYTTYFATFTTSGARAVTVELDPARGYVMDPSDVIDAISSKTRVVVLNTPSNPLGSCYSESQLEPIVAACVRQGIWLVLDAVYLDIVSRDKVFMPHQLPGASEILITVGSLSKSHRMTGWRVGWAIGPEALSSHLANLCLCMHYGLQPFVQDAAVAAIEQAGQISTVVREALARRRQIALAHLVNLEPAKLLDSGEGMFILLDVAPLGISARDFAMHLLDTHDVSVLPCEGFGAGGERLVRIGLCVDDERLETAIRTLTRCVQQDFVAR